MKMIKIAQVSKEQLFQAIVSSFKEDYFQNTAKKLEDSEIISGLNYIRKFGRDMEQQVRVIVKEFQPPCRYTAHFQSNRGEQKISYQFREVTPHTTEIIYEYQQESSNFFQRGNDFLINLLMKKSLERQTDAQLEAFIRYSKECQQKGGGESFQ